MYNQNLVWGLVILFTISLVSCERPSSKTSSSSGEKPGKIISSPSGAPTPFGPPELSSEASPAEGGSPSTSLTPGGEIASLPKESTPPSLSALKEPGSKNTYISTLPLESGGLVRLASAETFPAVFKRVVAQFTYQEAAKLPRGWEIKEFAGVARAEVVKVDGIYALRLHSAGTSFSVHKDLEIDLRQTPYLTWSWKVEKIPPRGDVRQTKSDDQAAQLYLVFPFFPPTLRSKLIGYIWDSTTPKGTILQSPTINLAKVIVVESGNAKLGHWITETRNVYEDYKMLFGTEPPKLGKVAVHINTNRTQSSAESYFANIFFHSAPTAELK